MDYFTDLEYTITGVGVGYEEHPLLEFVGVEIADPGAMIRETRADSWSEAMELLLDIEVAQEMIDLDLNWDCEADVELATDLAFEEIDRSYRVVPVLYNTDVILTEERA